MATLNAVLEVEGCPVVQNPSPEDLETVFAVLSPRKSSYVILNNPDGSYVQAAGARLRLTLEYRQIKGGDFQHYVLGRPSGAKAETSINYSGGCITLQRNEILSARDAVRVFKQFLSTGVPPDEYEYRNATALFT